MPDGTVIFCANAAKRILPKKRFCRSTKDVFLLAIGYGKDALAFCMDGFGLLKKCFAKQSYRFSSLFSLHFSLEKVAGENGEKREERREKSEEHKKKKPPRRLFLFGGEGGIRTRVRFRAN